MAKRLLSERLMSQKVELGSSVTSACVVNYNPNALIYCGGFLKAVAKPSTTVIFCDLTWLIGSSVFGSTTKFITN